MLCNVIHSQLYKPHFFDNARSDYKTANHIFSQQKIILSKTSTAKYEKSRLTTSKVGNLKIIKTIFIELWSDYE